MDVGLRASRIRRTSLVAVGRHPKTVLSSDRHFSRELLFPVGFRDTELHNSVPSPGFGAWCPRHPYPPEAGRGGVACGIYAERLPASTTTIIVRPICIRNGWMETPFRAF